MGVAVTGASGYLGSGLCDYFIARGVPGVRRVSRSKERAIKEYESYVTEFDYSIDAWEKILNNCSTIVHLAANTNPGELTRDVSRSTREYLNPLINLGIACQITKKKPFVLLASTVTLYGDVTRPPADETYPPTYLTIYEDLKSKQEELIRHLGKSGIIDYCIFRLSNVYGPSSRQSKSTNRGVLNRVAEIMAEGNSVSYFNGGKSFRDYIYISDVHEAIYRLIESKNSRNQVFNICSGTSISIRDAFEKIALEASKRYGYVLKLSNEIRDEPPIDRRNFWGSNRKLMKYTGWVPHVDFQTGIERLLNFLEVENDKQS